MPEIERYFQYEHLPEGPLRDTSKLFSDLADTLIDALPEQHETTVALRKLLEAKDAAVRSALDLHKDVVVGRAQDEMPAVHHGGAGGVITYVQSTRPDTATLMEGDLWIPEAGAQPLRWSQDQQDWMAQR